MLGEFSHGSRRSRLVISPFFVLFVVRTWIPALDQVEGGPCAGMTGSLSAFIGVHPSALLRTASAVSSPLRHPATSAVRIFFMVLL
jgi:hypothetical protein